MSSPYKSLRWPALDLNELRLADFMDELRRLKNGGDIEVVHGHADDVLCDLILWNDCNGGPDTFNADEIVALYTAVPKWYA